MIINRVDLKGVGSRIREIRGRQTQVQFAEKFGFKQAKISRFERGLTQYLPIDLIYRMCKENEKPVSLEWLFTGKGEKYVVEGEAKMDTPPTDIRLRNIVQMLEQLLNEDNFRGLGKVEELLASLLGKE